MINRVGAATPRLKIKLSGLWFASLRAAQPA
jgi:hypothetical protein